MITAIFIVIGIIVFGGILAGVLWFVSYTRRSARVKKTASETPTMEGLPFRWRYVILPPAILLLSSLLSLYFYYQLPAEVATHFELDGTPDRWLSREITMAWVLVPQLLLTVLAIATTWGITRMGPLFRPAAGALIKPERILLFMGNIFALPQLILDFAMLDIFSYNSYQRHIMPMWIFLLIILGLATIALVVLLILTILKAKQQWISQPSQQTKE
jgi:uncharacterized membrane protein